MQLLTCGVSFVQQLARCISTVPAFSLSKNLANTWKKALLHKCATTFFIFFLAAFYTRQPPAVRHLVMPKRKTSSSKKVEPKRKAMKRKRDGVRKTDQRQKRESDRLDRDVGIGVIV